MNFRFFICYIIVIYLTGCSRQRNLVYFSDLNTSNEVAAEILNNGEPVILQDDVLGIAVNSSSPESNVLFASVQNYSGSSGLYEKEGYRVSDAGQIKFPVIGKIKLQGLTISQAQDLLETALTKYVKNPIVNIKFTNFRITVIGEVNRPSTFTVTNEKINLLEALGLAGDMTPYGKRENVLIIRETEGTRVMQRLDVNSRNAMNSPYFYLKQNDVIYVEPDKAKSVEVSNNNRLMPLVVAAISAVAVLATTFLTR